MVSGRRLSCILYLCCPCTHFNNHACTTLLGHFSELCAVSVTLVSLTGVLTSWPPPTLACAFLINTSTKRSLNTALHEGEMRVYRRSRERLFPGLACCTWHSLTGPYSLLRLSSLCHNIPPCSPPVKDLSFTTFVAINFSVLMTVKSAFLLKEAFW